MSEAVDRLVGLMPDGRGFDLPYSELRDLQVAAVNERFQDRIGKIKMLKHRGEEASITEIRRLEDVVPLLLPHTAY